MSFELGNFLEAFNEIKVVVQFKDAKVMISIFKKMKNNMNNMK